MIVGGASSRRCARARTTVAAAPRSSRSLRGGRRAPAVLAISLVGLVAATCAAVGHGDAEQVDRRGLEEDRAARATTATSSVTARAGLAAGTTGIDDAR